MEVILDLALNFLDFLDGLSFFFFAPLSEVSAKALAWIGASEGTLVNTFLESFFSKLLSFNPVFANMSVAVLFLGGGIIFVLTWRFVVWLIDLFN